MTHETFQHYSLVPLDPYALDDHDDRDDPRGREQAGSRRLAAHEKTMLVRTPVPVRVVVPFIPTREGDYGPHVEAVKRAHARYRGGGRLTLLSAQRIQTRRRFGEYFRQALLEDQQKLGIPVTGVYDEATWHGLSPWFDSFARSLIHPKAPIDPKVAGLTAWLQTFYSTRAGRPYSQARASQVGVPAEKVTRADCSGMVAGACSWVDLLPRVDWRWTNTDSQIAFGLKVFKTGDIKIHDVVFYGDRRTTDPSHEAIVVAVKPEIIVQSFGSYPCSLRPLDYRADRIEVRRFL